MVRKRPVTNFGSSVSNTLTELNLTQSDLSRKLGKNPVYVNHIMTGYRKPSPEYVDLIATALNLNRRDRIKLHKAAATDHGWKLDLTKE